MDSILEGMSQTKHEEVVFGYDDRTGLRAIIAVHSTALGPSLGGTRWYPYESEAEALHDVFRLSEAMTYKASAAGLNLGGGKAVIIGEPETADRDRVLAAYGRLVDSLGGRYVTAEDVGTTVADMVAVRRETPHVAGLPQTEGGSGDPSPLTARGVLVAMRAAAEHAWGDDSLVGRRVAVAGVGKVGAALVRLLAEQGCEVLVADVDAAAVRTVVERHGAKAVAPEDILSADCDVLAPCALGGVLSSRSLPTLRCELIVGAANNQLATAEVGAELRRRGILYAPDFVVNAGGLINIANEVGGYDRARAEAQVDGIGDTIREVLRLADERDIDSHTAALHLARERLARAER